MVLDDAQNIPLINGQLFIEQSHFVMVERGKTVRMYKDVSEGSHIFGMNQEESRKFTEGSIS